MSGIEGAILEPKDLLQAARTGIDLETLGIQGFETRRGIAGGIVIEIPGPDSAEKADKFAAEMRKVLGDEARVTRPSRTLDLRISGVEESVTVEELLSAVAVLGGCGRDQIRLGPFRDSGD
jgi:hypothetical protein